MTEPLHDGPTAVSRQGGPMSALALFVFAGFWALAALMLGVGMWQETDPRDSDPAVAVNAPAVTVIVLCLLGASLCAVGGAIVDQVAKRRAVETDA